jgi:c(7)-type cytochrome triheme protein
VRPPSLSLPSRLLLLLLALPALGMKLPIPHLYGRVQLNNTSGKAKVPPVGFDHWRHRARFTCRLCHVDIGFAMTAGETKVSASSNRSGYHCGACHDGRTRIQGKVVFASCSDATTMDEAGACRRCHARADAARLQHEYATLAAGLPRDKFGGIDWEAAEQAGQIRPLDFLERVSIARAALRNTKEITIRSRGTWMADVRFSHPKHAVWNGCEVCHPDIFPTTGGGATHYSMMSITAGEACGACHDKVAFPLADCSKCHLGPMQ